VKAGDLQKQHALKQLEPALEKSIITNEEADLVRETEKARYDSILVDEFTLDEYMLDSVSPEDMRGLEDPEKETVILK
jgi:hypothetical protein